MTISALFLDDTADETQKHVNFQTKSVPKLRDVVQLPFAPGLVLIAPHPSQDSTHFTSRSTTNSRVVLSLSAVHHIKRTYRPDKAGAESKNLTSPSGKPVKV